VKRRTGIVIFLFLAFAGILILIFLAHREPSFKGRTLTSWLKQWWDAPLDDSKRLTEAQDAVRAIGATNALPFLVRLAEAQDGPIRSWIIAHSERWKIPFPRFQDASQKQMLAVAGFEILRTNCAPAVPELTRMLDDPNHAFTAVRCLSETGKEAEFALCRGLTNQNAQVRRWSIPALAAVTEDVEVYIDRVKPLLHDSDGMVQRTALEAIGDQTNAPELVVPILINALTGDSMEAAMLLANYGTNALVGFTVLSNAVEHGTSETARQALRTLVVLAPQAALPMVLARMHAPDPMDRVSALGLLREYAATNSDVLPALEGAAADSSSIVSRPARLFLTELYQSRHPEETRFPNEPVYGGKGLGEWLKRRHDGFAFSEDAEVALRQMGTNLIPALLYRLAYKRPPYNLPAYEVNMEATAAFMVLGEQLKAALPDLEQFMDNDDGQLAVHAMLATVGMGKDGVRSLIKGLSSQHIDMRNEAAHYLIDGPATQFPTERKSAVPFLIKLLSDTNDNVRINATNALKEIDPQTAARVGIR